MFVSLHMVREKRRNNGELGREKAMKTFMIAVVGLGIAATSQAASPRTDDPRADERRQSGAGNGSERTESLTTAQKAKVKAILSKYKANALTAAEARAIHEAFRQAGLRGGPALNDAVKAAGFNPNTLRDLAPPPCRDSDGGRRAPESRKGEPEPNGPPPGEDGERPQEEGNRQPPTDGQSRGQGRYSIEQAVSDRAQLHTIAFDGLAFLTGDFGCNTFLPPGKVADFCGFQYMRDVDSNKLGHNTSFVPRAANNMLFVLTAEQKTELVALALEQEKMLIEFVRKRFPLIKAFCRHLEGDIPSGSAGLNREAVMKYTADLYEIDGLLSYRRAEVLGGIIRSLTAAQKDHLGKMVFDNSSTWPELDDQVDKKTMSHTAHVAVMTYASEMFSWYAGNLEADVYFCPERHATYFGSFYMKDIPAMGNANFTINEALTGDTGEAFLAALTESQRGLVAGLVDRQRADLAEIVKTRRAIATELRRFMKETAADRDKVMALSKRYGELDGEISYFYATTFAQVARTLTTDQKTALLKLRNLDAKYTCKGAYLYSRAVAMPEIPNTDFLFGPSAAAAAAETGFVLRSPAVIDGGRLPRDFTGEGTGSTLPIEWSGAPAGTESYALIMHHLDPEGRTKWYWVLYNIPPDTKVLPKNVKNVGTIGNNSVNGRAEYAPPQSKGPGAKTYVYTLYALSAPVSFGVQASEVSRDALLTAMRDRILATAEMRVVYSRLEGVAGRDVSRRTAP
jgi:phosphatidylethanolamine-binding protein (PEBP) family uncharacterized protein/Spy/CpxP family protein refolding chaperone